MTGIAEGSGDGVRRLAEMIRQARSVVALTGAGVSVPSGIPDFRTPRTGLWANVDPMEVAHIDVFHADPQRFWKFYGDRFASLGEKQPNDAHRVLVAMERAGLLRAVITQNIDRLHARAGSGNRIDSGGGGSGTGGGGSATGGGGGGPVGGGAGGAGGAGGELIEVHGSIARCSCLRCGAQVDLEKAQSLLAAAADGVPRCEVCGEPLKPEVVLFGENLPERALRRAGELAAEADLMICVGSSLEVWPVAQLPSVTLSAGGAVALVTAGPTPLDRDATVKLSGDVVAELTALAAALDLDLETIRGVSEQ